MAAANKRGKVPLSDKHKDSCRAGALMTKLDRYVTLEPGDPNFERFQMSPGQIQAAQILLKKLVPDLSAVEQTVKDDRDSMTEEQILQQMKMMVESSPELGRQLLDMLTPKSVAKKVA